VRTWTPESSEFEDCNQASLETVIKRIWRCTCRPYQSEFGDRNRANLEMHLQAVIEPVWTGTGRQLMDSAPCAETLFISYVTRNHGNVTR